MNKKQDNINIYSLIRDAEAYQNGGKQMKSDRFLIKAAELYYRDGLSQQEIAKKLHTSRTSISRASTGSCSLPTGSC